MTPELDKKLVEKYPEIFRDRYKSPQETCLSFGLECGDGWYNLIDMTCFSIQSHLKCNEDNRKSILKWNANVEDPDYEWLHLVPRELREVPEEVEPVVAIQIKEKLGSLRFYYNGGDEYIRGVVDLAENMSYRLCEVCGAPGERNKEGWLKTLCKEHKND